MRPTFKPEVLSAVSNYEFAVTSEEQPDASFLRTAKLEQMFLPVSLTEGVEYMLHVRPCFAHTCTQTAVTSSFTLTTKQPKAREMRAKLGIDNTAPVTVDNRFLFEASWESFDVDGGERAEVYDWSIAKHKDGSEMVLNWTRIEAGLIDTIQVQHMGSRNV